MTRLAGDASSVGAIASILFLKDRDVDPVCKCTEVAPPRQATFMTRETHGSPSSTALSITRAEFHLRLRPFHS